MDTNGNSKTLLIKDLSQRLPYGVKVKCPSDDEPYTLLSINLNKEIVVIGFMMDEMYVTSKQKLVDIKPYLRPISSMTEEELEDFWKNVLDIDWRELEFDEEPDEVPFPFTENDCGFYLDNLYLADLFAVIDWFNEYHFDYRGLIPKGIALSTEEFKFNPYKNQ